MAAIVLGTAALRAASAAGLPLLEAEAYYWTWSLDPAWGYYDHPPMIALLIRAGTAIAGHGALGVRLGSVVLSALGSLLLLRLCRRVTSDRAALACLLFASLAPFWLPFGLLATPDAPLLFSWTAALLAFVGALDRGSLARWLLAGVATGLAILSKYTAWLLLPVFLATLLATPRGRGWLRAPAPYLALLTALLVVAPNLAWNAAHGGSTVATPFAGGVDLSDAPVHLASLAALPLLLLTPLVAAAWVHATVAGLRAGRWRDDERFVFLCCASWLPFAAFAAVSIVTEIHVHWIAPCFVAAVPLALENLGPAPRPGPGPRLLRRGIALGAALTLLLLAAPWIVRPLGARAAAAGETGGLARAAREMSGWNELGERLATEIAARRGERPVFLASQNYHLVSKARWLTGGRWPGLPLEREHFHQYLYWTEGGDYRGWDAMYAEKSHDASDDRRLRRAFRHVERLPPVTGPLPGDAAPRFTLYWCQDFQGVP